MSDFHQKLLCLEAQYAVLNMSADLDAQDGNLLGIQKNIAELYEQYVSKLVVVKRFANGECAFRVFNKSDEFIAEIYGSYDHVQNLACYSGDDFSVNRERSSNLELSVSMRSNLLETIFVYVNDDIVYQGDSYTQAESAYRNQIEILESVKPEHILKNSTYSKLEFSVEM
ncbi:MAG: hypothetical protein COA42_06280 [Alteromonadaceae bacterium]|nr:MAG: hypothetical protein COA42_06280 [Alteromonadaceae bacterium]